MSPRKAWLFVLAALVFGGCESKAPCPHARLEPLGAVPTFAVVTSDYSSTAIALLDASGERVTEAWIDSGTTNAVLSATLSGDVVLPTTAIGSNVLTLIDRFGVDVVTRVGLPGGNVLAQIPTTPPMRTGETAFRANPQDVVDLGDGTALVSRHEPNLDPTATPLDRGNDLLHVDLERGTMLGRIPLDALDAREGDDTRFARPSRLARLGTSFLVVGLARLSADFMRAAEGAVAVLQLSTEAVQKIPIGGLVNCGQVAPRMDGSVLVLCSGAPFGDDETRRAGAGLAIVRVAGDDTVRAEVVWNADAQRDLPPPLLGLVPLDGTTVAVIAAGNRDAHTSDRILVIDTETAHGAVAFESEGEFVLGQGVYDAASGLVLVPDANVGVRRFHWTGSGLAPIGVTEVSPCRGLPAREVRRIGD